MNSLCNPYLFSDQVDRDLTENSEKGRFDVATYEVVFFAPAFCSPCAGRIFWANLILIQATFLTTLQKIKNVGAMKDPHGQRLLLMLGTFRFPSDHTV